MVPPGPGLLDEEEPESADLAMVALEIGKVKPHKRKRLSFLARNHPDLIDRTEETGLIWACNVNGGAHGPEEA